jgi:hypothetical protein
MLPVIPKPPITTGQKKAALVVAGIADVLQMAVFPSAVVGWGISNVIDVVVAFILFAICGFKWQFLLAFMVELLPVAQLFPTWSAVVLMLSSEEPRINIQPVNPPPTAVKNNYVEVDAVVVPPVQPGKLEKARSPLAP